MTDFDDDPPKSEDPRITTMDESRAVDHDLDRKDDRERSYRVIGHETLDIEISAGKPRTRATGSSLVDCQDWGILERKSSHRL